MAGRFREIGSQPGATSAGAAPGLQFDQRIITRLLVLISASPRVTERRMMSRIEIDTLLRELYAARVSADFEGLCALFSEDAKFELTCASAENRTSVDTKGVGEFRPLLKLLVRTFKISDQVILATIIDGSKAAVHWRAKIYSRITGSTVATEFIDIFEVRERRISSYLEFFVPH